MKCTCGREYTEAQFTAGSLGFTYVPAGGPGEPPYIQEWSNPCSCGSTTVRDLPLWRFESLVVLGFVVFERGITIARRVRRAA